MTSPFTAVCSGEGRAPSTSRVLKGTPLDPTMQSLADLSTPVQLSGAVVIVFSDGGHPSVHQMRLRSTLGRRGDVENLSPQSHPGVAPYSPPSPEPASRRQKSPAGFHAARVEKRRWPPRRGPVRCAKAGSAPARGLRPG